MAGAGQGQGLAVLLVPSGRSLWRRHLSPALAPLSRSPSVQNVGSPSVLQGERYSPPGPPAHLQQTLVSSSVRLLFRLSSMSPVQPSTAAPQLLRPRTVATSQEVAQSSSWKLESGQRVRGCCLRAPGPGSPAL